MTVTMKIGVLLLIDVLSLDWFDLVHAFVGRYTGLKSIFLMSFSRGMQIVVLPSSYVTMVMMVSVLFLL